MRGIDAAKEGNYVSDIGHAVQTYVELLWLFCGYGI